MDETTAFKLRFRGVPTNIVARAFSSVSRGIDWRGCSKEHMAQEFADRKERQGLVNKNIHDLTLDELEIAVDMELKSVKPRPKPPTGKQVLVQRIGSARIMAGYLELKKVERLLAVAERAAIKEAK